MNAYRRRKQKRDADNKLRREADRIAVLLRVESTMREHEAAVLAVQKRKVTLTYHHGHIIGAGPKQLTVEQLHEETRRLWALQHELDFGGNTQLD